MDDAHNDQEELTQQQLQARRDHQERLREEGIVNRRNARILLGWAKHIQNIVSDNLPAAVAAAHHALAPHLPSWVGVATHPDGSVTVALDDGTTFPKVRFWPEESYGTAATIITAGDSIKFTLTVFNPHGWLRRLWRSKVYISVTFTASKTILFYPPR